MLRNALTVPISTLARDVIAIPQCAAGRPSEQRNRGSHRILVPVHVSLEASYTLRYIVEHWAPHAASIHLLNVQSPLMTGDVTSLVDGRVVTELRRVAGEQILDGAIRTLVERGIPVTHEVAFGPRAETICRVAEERHCTGIVMAVRTGFGIMDVIGGSVAAQVLRLAGVPVTTINERMVVPFERRDRRALPASSVRASSGSITRKVGPSRNAWVG